MPEEGAGIFGLFQSVAESAASFAMQDYFQTQGAELAETAAQNADKRKRALYEDYYSPIALTKQIKEAGLSPSLMYAQGGNFGQTTPAGNQGGPIATNAPRYDMDAVMNNALIAAQIENIKEDTRGKGIENDVNEETALETAYANLEQIFAEAGLSRAQTNLTELKSTKQEIDNMVAAEFDYATANAKLMEMNANVENLWQDVRIKSVKATIAENTQETQIKQIAADLEKTYKDIQIKIAEKALLKAQKANVEEGTKKWAAEIEEIGNRISQKWTELGIEEQKRQDKKKWFEETAKAELEKAAAAGKNADTEEMRVIWHSVNESVDVGRVLLKDIIGAVMTRGMSLGMPSTNEKVTQSFDKKGNLKGEQRTYERTRPQNKQ